MKQTMRKILAVLVVFSIVLSVGVVALSGSAAEEVFFYDPFEDGNLSGWSSSTIGTHGTLENGTFVVPAGRGANKVITTGASELTDYYVEAKLQMRQGVLTSNPPNVVSVSIVGRADKIGSSGYELGLRYNHTNDSAKLEIGLIARDGSVGAAVIKKTEKVENILGVGNAEPYDAYTLKMVMDGSTISCYINGQKAFDYVSTTFTKGSPGLAASGIGQIIDDYKVVKLTGDAASSSSEASSAVSSGDDSSTTYFYDSFDTSEHIASGEWTLGDNKTKVVGQHLSSSAGRTYLKDHAVVSGLTDYAVEATVKMDSSENLTPGVSSTFAGIIGRMVGSTGYEFTLLLNKTTKKGCVRIWDRVGGVQVGKNLLDGQILADTEYKLTMVFSGATLKCFVNEQLVAVETVTQRAGTAGLTVANGYNTLFNDFTVRKATQAELDAALGGDTSSSTSSGNTSSGNTSSDNTSSGNTSSGNTSSLPQGVYFQEDFEDQLKQTDGWQSDIGVTNGRYTKPSTVAGTSINVSKHQALSAMTNYVVEAKITVDESVQFSNFNNSVAALIGRNDGTGGVEFGFFYTHSSSKRQMRIYDRKAVYTQYVAINDWVSNKQYTLKMLFQDSTIKFFVDGEIVAELTDQTPRAGYVGFMNNGMQGYLDDLVVRAATQAELNATMGGGTSSDTSSGGAPDDFTPPAGTIFYEDFNDKLKTADGWSKAAAVNAAGKFTSTPIYLSNHTAIKAMRDYAIDVEVQVDTSGTTGVNTNVAAIVGRYATVGDKTGGYEIGYANERDSGKSYIRVYDRVNTTGKGEFKNVELTPGATYKLTAVFVGTTLRVYLDDELLGELQVEDRAGTAGLVRSGYTAYFDNFVVRTPSADEINPPKPQAPEADANGIYYKDSFSNRANFLNSLWSDDFEGIENGAAVLSANDSRKTYLVTGDKGYFGLTDYTVEAKITIDPNFAALKNGANITLTGRVNSMEQGYEFGIETNNNKLSLRLYDRVSGSVNGVNGKTMLGNRDVQLETGKQYTLRLVMVGDIIRGYVDREKVFEWKNTSAASGTAGLRVDSLQAFVDDFVVRKPTAAEIKGEGGVSNVIGGGTTGNPGTGDSVLYVCIALCGLLAAAVALQLAKRRKA